MTDGWVCPHCGLHDWASGEWEWPYDGDTVICKTCGQRSAPPRSDRGSNGTS